MARGNKPGPLDAETGDKLSGILGGKLQLLGMELDLGRLIDSPEQVRETLEGLRSRLKAAGGREVLSDSGWRSGDATVSGVIRTRGALGNREFHIGTAGADQPVPERRSATVETVEPAVDVFNEEKEILIVADVPGVALKDLEVGIKGRTFSLATKSGTRHGYRKELELPSAVDAARMRVSCRNGVLEVRVPKPAPRRGSSAKGAQ
jgi:HSP20 family molecular chaperone IbpA